jgi:hypothetical protein
VAGRDSRSESWVGNGLRFDHLGEAWTYGRDLLNAWAGPKDFRVMVARNDFPMAIYSCQSCWAYVAGQMMPSHAGSRMCESGSLASGGDRTHCTCDTCF